MEEGVAITLNKKESPLDPFTENHTIINSLTSSGR